MNDVKGVKMPIMMKNDRESTSYIGTFQVGNPDDAVELDMVKSMVKWFNKSTHKKHKVRLCLRGRKPKTKMNYPGGYFLPKSKGPVSYNPSGNIMGGIKNATVLDAYIYRRA
tara:strand:+ start:354 stop:689 length:336 start_codon:yes stop_codon:yes gene_type:complete